MSVCVYVCMSVRLSACVCACVRDVHAYMYGLISRRC